MAVCDEHKPVRCVSFFVYSHSFLHILNFFFASSQNRNSLLPFFQRLMWRSTKKQVVKEIGLPTQETFLSSLRFSAIEAYHYRRLQQQLASSNLKHINRIYEGYFNGTIIIQFIVLNVSFLGASALSEVTQYDLRRFLNFLAPLRQVCVHPQLSKKSGVQSLQKQTLTMDELLLQHVVQAEVFFFFSFMVG